MDKSRAEQGDPSALASGVKRGKPSPVLYAPIIRGTEAPEKAIHMSMTQCGRMQHPVSSMREFELDGKKKVRRGEKELDDDICPSEARTHDLPIGYLPRYNSRTL